MPEDADAPDLSACSPSLTLMAQLTTFVFTDLVGSVTLKQRMPGADAATRDAAYVERVLTPHRQRIEAGLADADGRVVSTAGDGHFLVFPDTARAALWALRVVRSHVEDPIFADGGAVAQVRIGMHAGTPQPDPADPDNFIGRAVDYAARLADHAQGGQVLVSRTTASLIEDGALDGVRLHPHGRIELRGIGGAELYELLDGGRQATPPRRRASDSPARQWSVLPRTMALTEYAAGSSAAAGGTSSATAVRPRRVGNYELAELLGHGGMGNVYKARHAQFERPRAVKIIRPDLVEAGGDTVVERFYQEIRATGALEHPNLVVAIDSSSPEDDEHYLVMEFVDGVGVDRMLESEGALPVADACEIARQAALGLEHLYEQGLVHRDVKPSNLMITLVSNPHLAVTPGGAGAAAGDLAARSAGAKLPVVKLMDLGLALLVRGDDERLTRLDRGGMGTGHYMSPEQWRTTSVDIRADVYSLGCTLYHLLMGEPPFARSDLKPERAHATATPPPLRPPTGAPRELVRLIESMMAKRPQDRPQTPGQVADALAPLAAGHRLAERVRRLQRGESSAGRADGDETRPAPRGEADTRRPRTLVSSTAEAAVRRSPWLLVAATTLAACAAVFALSYANRARLEQHQESLLRTARFAATDVADAIDKRVGTLAKLASRPELRRAVKQAIEEGDRSALQAWLSENRGFNDESLNLDSSSWFVTDPRGEQLARDPWSDSIGQNYAHRDYFHGLGADLPENPSPAPDPISEPHQSAVYQSDTTSDLKLAFSAPITEGKEVLGVLAMSVELGNFDEFRKTDDDAGPVEILLVDVGENRLRGETFRGLVLHHRNLGRFTRGGPARLSDGLVESIRQTRGGRNGAVLPTYDDVFERRDGEPMIGAVMWVTPSSLSPDQRHSWVVVAQEPKP
ncbi:protein kinase [Botrimarina sp.]|uniref:protein kinase domain-containing protein n=1 Tax=Botrimarina sp. TaxID=2795802 RepID=UPI0032EF878F